MSWFQNLDAAVRQELGAGVRPSAQDERRRQGEADGFFGFVHSCETASLCDGPGLRFVLFLSGCPLRCSYCHNPDMWRLRDGTFVSADHVIARLETFAPAFVALGGGLTLSGGEPLMQLAFTRRILSAAKKMGLHTAIETSGYLGDRVDDRYLSMLDLVLLDIKSSDPDTYRKLTGRELAPTLRFAERLAALGKRVWVRFTLIPGCTDDTANAEGVAKFIAPMKHVEWVEVEPFHQLGAFKWKALNLEYKHATTPSPTPGIIGRVLGQFHAAAQCPLIAMGSSIKVTTLGPKGRNAEKGDL